MIFAAFTQAQQGGKGASNLLRGVIVGSGGNAAFFTVVGAMLTTQGVAITYLVATAAAIGVGSAAFFLSKKNSSKLGKN